MPTQLDVTALAGSVKFCGATRFKITDSRPGKPSKSRPRHVLPALSPIPSALLFCLHFRFHVDDLRLSATFCRDSEEPPRSPALLTPAPSSKRSPTSRNIDPIPGYLIIDPLGPWLSDCKDSVLSCCPRLRRGSNRRITADPHFVCLD